MSSSGLVGSILKDTKGPVKAKQKSTTVRDKAGKLDSKKVRRVVDKKAAERANCAAKTKRKQDVRHIGILQTEFWQSLCWHSGEIETRARDHRSVVCCFSTHAFHCGGPVGFRL